MILVTGGTGFLGAHLLLELIKQEERIRVIISERSNPEKVFAVWRYYVSDPEKLLDNIEWYRGDISGKSSIEDAFINVSQVYHCAAVVAFDRRIKKKIYDVNVAGTKNIVNLSLEYKVKKLVHVSSIAALGDTLTGSEISENAGWPINTKSVYSKTKTQAELEVWRGIAEGLNAVIVNPSVILGPGNWLIGSPRFFYLVDRGLKYYTLGKTGFVSVHDVVNAMIMLMNNEISNERYVLTSENLALQNFFEKIAVSIGKPAPTKYASPFLLSLGWRLEYLISFFTHKIPGLTKQGAKTAHAIQTYSAEKFSKQFGYVFKDIDQTILEIGKFYKAAK